MAVYMLAHDGEWTVKVGRYKGNCKSEGHTHYLSFTGKDGNEFTMHGLSLGTMAAILDQLHSIVRCEEINLYGDNGVGNAGEAKSEEETATPF